jgi:hypothetical protein
MDGILLIALGKPNYLKFAINMAVSIRANGCSLPIALATNLDEDTLGLFDTIIKLDPEDYELNDTFSPGWCKVNMDRITPFESTIYLDVDSLAITNMDELMAHCKNKGGDVYSQGFRLFSTVTDKDWSCQWMPFQNVIKNYIHPKMGEVFIPEINSSFLYFTKGASPVFQKAREVMATVVPREDFGRNWGNSYPDELAFNVALGVNKINPFFGEGEKIPFYFRIKGEKTKSGTKASADNIDWIKSKFYCLGFFGDYGFNHFSMVADNGNQGYYNKLSDIYWNRIFQRNNPYKIFHLMKHKHVKSK